MKKTERGIGTVLWSVVDNDDLKYNYEELGHSSAQENEELVGSFICAGKPLWLNMKKNHV